MRKAYRESKSRSDDLTDDENLLQHKVKKSERFLRTLLSRGNFSSFFTLGNGKRIEEECNLK